MNFSFRNRGFQFTAMCAFALWAAAMDASAALSEGVIQGIGPVSPVEKLFGDFQFTEGPAADRMGNLYFSDIPANRIYKVDAQGKLSVFLEESGGANGLMFDSAGALYACQGGAGRVVKIDVASGAPTVLASQYKGEAVKPNDLVLDRAGGVYFTDPGKSSVYYVDSAGQLSRVIDNVKSANGVLLSPDEKTLYVISSGQAQMTAAEVTAPGKLGKSRVFCTLAQPTGQMNTGGDGATVDVRGNVYIASRAGVQVFTPLGEPLGVIASPLFAYPQHPANLTFGGPQGKTLYITARTGLYRAEMEATGHVFPGTTK